MSIVCRHVLVSGRVQGVGFRWHARTQAVALGVTGWIANLPDGRVEAWVEGDTERVEAMVVWLRKGPAMARVRGVEVVEHPPRGLAGFEVRR